MIGQYLQIDLESTKVITMVATQGRQDGENWVTKYALSYSQDGSNWIDYEGDCIQVRDIAYYSPLHASIWSSMLRASCFKKEQKKSLKSSVTEFKFSGFGS